MSSRTTLPAAVPPIASDITEPAPTARGDLVIGHLLEAGIARAPDQVIVDADGKRMSYRELGDRVRRLAAGLHSFGVRAGQTVAMMDWDSHRYLEVYFAVPMIGAVLHTVNVRLSPEQLAYTINHARDDLIVFNAEFLPMVEEIHDRLEPGTRLVLHGEGGRPATTLPIETDYERLIEGGDPSFVFPHLAEDTRATTFYTTGTTGLPKGVHFTHRQLVLHALVLASVLDGAWQGGGEDIYMPITPMFHVHAWGMPYVATMRGLKQVYPGRYHPGRLLDLIRDEGVTLSHCVPTILQSLLTQAHQRPSRLDGWKVFIGGAALSQSLVAEALELGADIRAGYGMSESGPLLAVAQPSPRMRAAPLEEQLAWRSKAGRPVPFVSLRIVDAAMNDVAPGATGEIVVRAPWLTTDYVGDAESSERLWAGGWMHTGDIGLLDGDGVLNVTDRLKDVIKTGGEWISSLALEDLIGRHAGVREVAVIGVSDPKWTERPLAVVVPREGVAVDAAALQTHLGAFAASGAIPRYGVPDRFVFVDSLPRTSIGKVDKKVLRARYDPA